MKEDAITEMEGESTTGIVPEKSSQAEGLLSEESTDATTEGQS